MRAVVVLCSAVALSACATSEPTPDPKVVAGKDVICERTVPTGSSLPTARCRTVDRAAADREDAQKALSGTHQRPRINGIGG